MQTFDSSSFLIVGSPLCSNFRATTKRYGKSSTINRQPRSSVFFITRRYYLVSRKLLNARTLERIILEEAYVRLKRNAYNNDESLFEPLQFLTRYKSLRDSQGKRGKKISKLNYFTLLAIQILLFPRNMNFCKYQQHINLSSSSSGIIKPIFSNFLTTTLTKLLFIKQLNIK